MNLSDLFQSRSVAKVLDAVLANPETVLTQSMLVDAVGLNKRTVRRVLEHMARLDVLTVDRRFSRMAVVSLNGESELAEALLDFYRRLRRVPSVSRGGGTFAQSQ